MCGSLCPLVEPVLIRFLTNRYLLRSLIRRDLYENPNRKRLVNLHRANKRVNRLLVGDKCISNAPFVQEIERELERSRTRIRRGAIKPDAQTGKRSRGIISWRSTPIVIVTCAALGSSIRERKRGFSVRNGKRSSSKAS